MADQKASGCLGWIVLGVLGIAALSQCGKEDAATPSPSALLSTPSSTVATQWLYVQPDTLNCRAGPTAQSLSLRSLKRGENVGVVRTDGSWSQIKGDVLCWAKSSYLQDTPPAAKPERPRREEEPRRANGLSTAAIKRQIIRASIDSYPGNCACPYNTARNGSRCGGRSAYNRAGGYAPLCYAGDVTAQDVAAWRARQ